MKQIKITDETNSNSFTFYDNSSGTILRAFDGFEYPEVISSIEDVSGAGGAYYVNSKFGRRRMSFQGDLVGDKFTQRRDLLTVLRQEGNLKLFEVTTYDDLELEFEAEIVRLTMPYTHQIHSFLFELQAPDWRFYSTTESSTDIDPSDSAVVENGGIEITDPIITVTGPASGIEVDNLMTGEEFTLDDLSAGEVVVINVKERTVLKDDVNAYSEFTGDFFSLQPGNNEITFAATSTTGDTNLEIAYQDAYMGI